MIRYHPQQRGTPRTLWEAKAEKQNSTKVPHYAATTDNRREKDALFGISQTAKAPAPSGAEKESATKEKLRRTRHKPRTSQTLNLIAP